MREGNESRHKGDGRGHPIDSHCRQINALERAAILEHCRTQVVGSSRANPAAVDASMDAACGGKVSFARFSNVRWLSRTEFS